MILLIIHLFINIYSHSIKHQIKKLYPTQSQNLEYQFTTIAIINQNTLQKHQMQDYQCPQRYEINDQGACEHYLFPLSFATIVGSILIPIITGLSSMAGLGGGGPSLVIFILCFNYIPKDANIIVFTSILGATLGNCVNQMSTAHNGEPIVKYRYAFVSLPIMFIGSYVGVFLNSYLPSLVICAIIISQSISSISKIKKRYLQSYQKQTKELLLHKQSDLQKDVIKQQRTNPFQNQQNIYIFKNLLLLILLFTAMYSLRGTEKMPSLIGIPRCSIQYWFILVLSLIVVGLFSYKNLQTLKQWVKNQQNKCIDSHQFEIQKDQSQTSIQKNIKEITYYSIMAGIFSGFGLGGGLFLVPMYRELGCQPLQATASTAFTIVIISTINCIQGILLGVISLQDFVYFIVIAGGGSYLISVTVSSYLRKIHRLSYVQYLLMIMIYLAIINIPISLITKYIQSGYDSSLILSFGSFC